MNFENILDNKNVRVILGTIIQCAKNFKFFKISLKMLLKIMQIISVIKTKVNT